MGTLFTAAYAIVLIVLCLGCASAALYFLFDIEVTRAWVGSGFAFLAYRMFVAWTRVEV